MSKTLFELVALLADAVRWRSLSHLAMPIMTSSRTPNFDFLRWRWHAIALSWVVILAGVVTIWTRGIPLGIEFAGGTSIIVAVRAADARVSRSGPRCHDSGGGAGRIVQPYGSPSLREIMIRLPESAHGVGHRISKTADDVQDRASSRPISASSQIVGHRDRRTDRRAAS